MQMRFVREVHSENFTCRASKDGFHRNSGSLTKTGVSRTLSYWNTLYWFRIMPCLFHSQPPRLLCSKAPQNWSILNAWMLSNRSSQLHWNECVYFFVEFERVETTKFNKISCHFFFHLSQYYCSLNNHWKWCKGSQANDGISSHNST